MSVVSLYDQATKKLNYLDGIAPLLLRLYLAPIFIQAGWTKFQNFEGTSAWFGNPDWGLGLPFPEVLALLAASTELVGGFLLLIGLFTRLISIPLAFTMVVAAITAHAENGWLALSDATSWLADGTILLNEQVLDAVEKKQAAISILKEYGNYEWLTSSGSITILNNGIEFAATYFIMVFVLIFTGGGRYTSIDHFLRKKFFKQGH